MQVDKYQDFTLLIDGKNAFPVILDAIENAEKSLEINMFIWRDDEIGNRLAQAVLKSADRGVKATISVDKYGSVLEHLEESRKSFFHKKLNATEKIKIWGLSVFYPEHRAKQKEKDTFSDTYRQLLSHPNIKIQKDVFKADHSKYYIIDKKTLILGGINVEDKENGKDRQGREYQDYMVKIDGERHVENFKAKLFKGENLSSEYYFGVNVKNGKPYRFEMKEEYLYLIRNAKKELSFVMAYFSPLKNFMEEILLASKRGVRVRVMLPLRANFQNDTNYKTARKLLEKSNGNIEIYFTPKMAHTKLVYTEDWLSFGSTNITSKAFKQLAELNLFVKNEPCAFTDTLKQSVEENFALAKKVTEFKQIKYNRLKTLVEGLLV